MGLGFHFKHNFFSTFREFFVHHHGSLEFRAKIFALLISANDDFSDQGYKIVLDIGMEIYKGDEERANLLMILTKEKVTQVREKNGLDVDNLITNIQHDLRVAPRYAKKIDPMQLKRIIMFTNDEDSQAYQENILEFLVKIKAETLKDKEEEYLIDEETSDVEPKN